ncbi:MAG: ABC transporter permease [Bacteroidota bacterium]
MIKNYFIVAFRNFRRNKIFSLINISGLVIGLTSVLLIVMYVQDELSYDKFLQQSDHIYQVNLHGNFGGDEFIAGTTPPPVGAALVNAFPEVETYTRIFQPASEVVRSSEGNKTEKYFTENAVYAVDSNFLQVFDFRLKEGNAISCLQKLNSVVLTEESAKKYFGNENPVGKTLLFGDARTPYTVTGVLYNIPSQSSLQFEMLTTVASYNVVKRFNWSWVWTQMITYIKLRDNVATDAASIQQLESKFPAMVKLEAASAFKRIGQPYDEFKKKGGIWEFYLQPLKSVHLYSAGIQSSLTTLSTIKYVYIFSAIAFFIILLACVNFMNLSTAQSSKRAKEVGIRKVVGSAKSQLIKQFLIEAMLYSFIASVIAFILVIVLLPLFNEVTGKTLIFQSFFTNGTWIFLIVLCIITGLLAGSYPAFYLSSLKPATVLKGIGTLKGSLGNIFLRNGLVIFQFAVSTILIICTIIVFQQLKYTQNKDLGLNKDNVVVIANANRLGNSEETFRQQVSALPNVLSASISTSVPAQNTFTDFYLPQPDDSNKQIAKDLTLSSFMVDENFVPTLQLKMLSGRNFSKDFADSTSVIINEETARQVGWKDGLGKYLQYPGNHNQMFKVIGVVKDFNVSSLRDVVTPFALFYTSSKTYSTGSSYVLARVKSNDLQNTLQAIQGKWKNFSADTPFDYSFLDNQFAALYNSEQRMSAVFGIFTFLSIFVACLGLFGLSIFTAERRKKEIGIRKTLGAKTSSIVSLISKDFLKLVLIAAVIAFPVAWYAMAQWLKDFAYRINISWWVFVLSAFFAIVIALFTISFQAIKAAIANPVKSLRSE